MTSVNTLTGINPFAAGLYECNTFVYNPMPTDNLGYIPFGGLTSGIDVSQYFGTLPPMPQMSFDIDALAASILGSIKTPTFDITLPSHNTVTNTNTDSAVDASVSTNITDSQSDLKPGLFKGRLAGQEALVSSLCKKYGVSPALVASIIGLESGWGTSNLAMHNNFGGYRAAGDLGKNAKGFGYFSTIEKGLEAMIKNLAGYTRYSDVSKVDFNNLDNIGRHYCEGNVWSSRVREIYNSRVSSYLA